MSKPLRQYTLENSQSVKNDNTNLTRAILENIHALNLKGDRGMLSMIDLVKEEMLSHRTNTNYLKDQIILTITSTVQKN
jgi:hypothetical protein